MGSSSSSLHGESGRRSSTLCDLLLGRAAEQPGRVAYVYLADGEGVETSLTYGELCGRARAVASALEGAAGARALLLYPPGLEYVAAFFGCLLAGVVAVPAPAPRVRRNLTRLEAIALDAQATLALTTAAAAPKLELSSAESPALASLRVVVTDTLHEESAAAVRRPPCDGRALAYLQYTSGSTAAPKGVMVTHENVLCNSADIHQGFEHTPDSVSLSWLPHFHDMGLVDGIIQPLYGGFRGILMSPAALLQSPARWLRAVSLYGATHSGGPNFAYDLCARRVTPEQRGALDLSRWRVAYNGAEPVRRETLERFVELFGPCGFRPEAFYPAYGLAEATLKVTGARADAAPVFRDVRADALARHMVVEAASGERDVRRLVGSGRASCGTEVVIVDAESARRCAPEEVGEIWVRGPGVAAGYWARPAETEQTFQARLATTGEGPFLRTGDLGFTSGGELFVTGRLKDLIIIRGRNLYPQDIEAAVERSHASLRPGGGAAFSVETESAEQLVVVQELEGRRRPADEADVFESIRETLAAEFELQPSAVLLVRPGSVPKTSSGKVRRRECRAKYLAGDFDAVAVWRASSPSAAPKDGVEGLTVEERLCAQVAACVGVALATIDVRQPIARYGLDSLAAVELSHALKNVWGIDASASSLLDGASVADLAASVAAQDERRAPSTSEGASSTGTGRGDEEDYSLSHGQRSLWFLYRLAPESAAYNVFGAVRILEELDADALRRAFDALSERHDALRTTFEERDGEPVRRVGETAAVAFNFEDAAGWDERRLRERLSAEAHRPFKLETGPLLRVGLFRLSGREHVMLIAAHHIVVDLWSLGVLLREAGEIFGALKNGERLPSVTPAARYADYVRRQRELLGSEAGARLAAYWERQLAGAPTVLELPADFARPRAQTFRGASLTLRLEEELTRRLKTLGLESQATPFVTLLAAFQVLLYRYTGERDLLVGSPTAGRDAAEHSDLVGYFVNPVVLRARPSGGLTFKAFLGQARRTVLEALAHQDYPFDLLVKRLQPERDAARSPVFQVMFTWQRARRAGEEGLAAFALGAEGARLRLGELRLESLALAQRVAQFDLSVTAAEVGGGLTIAFEYNTDLFRADTIRRMLGHFETLLRAVAERPEERLSELPLLQEDERRQLLEAGSGERAARDQSLCAHRLFERQAALTPDATAVVSGDERLSYAELNRRANQLARRLRARGVGAESRVAVLVERSPELIVCVLGVLKAGAAYVPLDPNYPQERLASMTRDSGATVLLTRAAESRAIATPDRVEVFDLDREADALARECAANLGLEIDARSLAYVIFTSGSTGRPKGAMVTHAGLVNAYLAWESAYRLREACGVHLQMASFSFDVFAGDLVRALCSGGRLVLCPSELLLEPCALYELMRRERVDCAEFVPAVARALLEYLSETGRTLDFMRLLVVGSDSWFVREYEELRRRCGPRTRLVNSYGLTEATIDSTFFEDPVGELESDAVVPVGRPFANTRAFVLDPHGQPLPFGVPGELHFGGCGLARGYAGRPAQTAERFVPDAFSSEPGARVYRTGDLARLQTDGLIELLGRTDQQVKIRGFRVELGEIEAVLGAHPSLKEAVVLARRDMPGEKRLTAYCVRACADTSGGELREFLRGRLPEFMAPSHFVFLDALPLSPNGKIDRAALPAPDADARAEVGEYVAPRTPREKILCGVWAEVLKAVRVGVNDNFFERGGDSILSLQVCARARRAGLGLTPRQLFECPTVAAQAAVAITLDAHAAEEAATGAAALTPIQRCFFEQDFPNPSHWNMSLLLAARERLDAATLEEAFARLSAHHDALRLRFVKDGSAWRQFYGQHDARDDLFRVEDVSHLEPAEQRAAVSRVADETQAALDLGRGPLLRAVLFETGARDAQRLLIVAHHLVIDGVSWRILLEDLTLVYGRLVRAESAALPPRTTSYGRWAALLEEHARGGAAREELAYWAGLPFECIAPLPLDESGGRNTEGAARTVSTELEEEETRALLQDVPGVYHTQVNDVLLAALARAFAPWTGRRRLLVELEGHGREDLFADADVSRTVGWFTSAFPVVLDACEPDAPGEALMTTKELLRGVPRRGINYGVLRYLDADPQVSARLRACPAPEVSFNYLGQLDQMLQGSGPFDFAREAAGATRNADAARGVLFEINASVMRGRLRVDWTYSGELHHGATVERLAASLVGELRALVAHCLTPGAGGHTPSDFPLVSLNREQLAELLAANPRATDILPLSPMQHGMLFHTLYAPRESVYTGQVSFTLRGELNVEAFARAWQELVARHDVLRTSFVWDSAGEPLQVVHGGVGANLARHDWRALTATEREGRWETLLVAEREREFDLAAAPLWRLALARTAEDEWRFVWTHHHALLDGWSVSLLLREVSSTYQASERGEAWAAPRARPYGDYLAWLSRQDVTAAEKFWRARLKGFTTATSLVVERARAARETAREERRLCVSLSHEETARLQSFARRHGLTPNTLVQGAWALLLARYNGADEVLFGATVAGRPASLAQSEEMVGLFINTLPVRVRVSEDEALVSWLRRLQTEQVSARDYEWSPLVDVQRWSEAPRGEPLFESLLVFENYPVDASLFGDGSGVRWTDVRSFDRTNYPLTVAAVPGTELSLLAHYWSDRLEDDAAARMLGHWRTLLLGMTGDDAQTVAAVPLMSEDESRRVFRLREETSDSSFADVCLHQLFEARAAQTPDATAVRASEVSLSYRELNERANRLAHRLRRLGVGAESRVGVLTGRDVETIVALLAVLKAGGAYLPLDPRQPPARLRFMLEDASAATVILRRGDVDELTECNAVFVNLEAERESMKRESTQNPSRVARPDSLAYVIYTSGSTGAPKGVACSHRSLVNLLADSQRRQPLSQEDAASCWTSFGFDVSLWEIFSPLTVGASLHLAPEEVRADAPSFFEWLRANDMTSAYVPAFMLGDLARWLADAGHTLALRWLLVGVEPIEEALLSSIARALPGLRILNGYGPTEATVYVTGYEVGSAAVVEQRTPIGRPISNTRVDVLDGRGRAMPVGVPGEIYVGGVQLARGYVGDEGRTAERFVPDASSCEAGARLYRTGDVGVWRTDGNLMFAGRRDSQLKVRGHRVEPGEIEAALNAHPQVRGAVVVAREDDAQGPRLAAYLVGEPHALGATDWRTFLKEQLPDYMIPAAFVFLERLPLTPSGKVDRRALPAPVFERAAGGEYVAPRTKTEEVLAGLWREVLGVERVGVNDHFFELGGHSLLATRVLAHVRRLFRTEITMQAVFEATTVAELARALAAFETEPGRTEKIARVLLKVKGLSAEEARAALRRKREERSKA